jgi:hypothetical protein
MKTIVYTIIAFFCLGITVASAHYDSVKIKGFSSESSAAAAAQKIAVEIDAGTHQEALMVTRRHCTRSKEHESTFKLQFTHFDISSVWVKSGDNFVREYSAEIFYNQNCGYLQIRPGDD